MLACVRVGAKYADALRKISLACFSSRTSRSKAFIFSACSVVMPPRWPVSTSTFLTHSFSVCGAQPIFDAIDTIAAQRLSCCPAPSRTIRTARSRTSPSHRNCVSTAGQRDEYLFVVLFIMLHPTHELEPPANPERFNLHFAENANTALLTMYVYKRVPHFSSLAKYAVVFFRIFRSSVTRASSFLRRLTSAS